MILIGTVMMVSCLMGGRLYAAGTTTLVGGFTTVTVGAILLTREPLAVFIYFCFTIAVAVIQLPVDGIISRSGALTLILSLVGFYLLKCLPRKRRR